MKNTILIIIFLVCISAECCKEKESPTYYMPQEFKDYVVFPQGSYWIYEDSISEKMDSIILQTQTTKILEPPSYNDWGYNYECLVDWVYSSYKNQTIFREGKYNEYIANNKNNSYIYYTGSYTGSFSPLFISNIAIGKGSDGLIYELFNDSIIINDNLYKDVKVFSTIGQYNNSFFLRTYYSRHIGLIKVIITKTDTSGTKVWELKKYHINH
ncbi:MAG: hypothetical protein HY738_13130 [Bacteroidia bacterium]|nr:hypothetical protein [Bacteroidia bacterium]